eukprot:10894104-Ditylum_brightwellii.AAC.1
MDCTTKPANWKWSKGHTLSKFKLGEKNKAGTLKVHKPVHIVEGTYCTKGQVHAISWFIEAVTDSL